MTRRSSRLSGNPPEQSASSRLFIHNPAQDSPSTQSSTSIRLDSTSPSKYWNANHLELNSEDEFGSPLTSVSSDSDLTDIEELEMSISETSTPNPKLPEVERNASIIEDREVSFLSRPAVISEEKVQQVSIEAAVDLPDLADLENIEMDVQETSTSESSTHVGQNSSSIEKEKVMSLPEQAASSQDALEDVSVGNEVERLASSEVALVEQDTNALVDNGGSTKENQDPNPERLEVFDSSINPIRRSSSRSERSTRMPAQRPVLIFAPKHLDEISSNQSSTSMEPPSKRRRSSSPKKASTEPLLESQPINTPTPEESFSIQQLKAPPPIFPSSVPETSIQSVQAQMPSIHVQEAQSQPIPAPVVASVSRIPYGPKMEGPPRAPKIWTDNRQEVCESLPYFLNYQGGIYSLSSSRYVPNSLATRLKGREDWEALDNSVYGYLLAGWGSVRDAWEEDGRVIISHGGGKSTGTSTAGVLSRPGSYSLSSDQVQSSPSTLALISAMKDGCPVPLLVGETYGFLPFSLNCGFAVLGWYLVTDAWAEKEVSQNGQSFIRWKFRFEYLESQGPPWWISDPEINPEPVRKPFWNPRQRTEKVDENQELLPIDGSAASELSEKDNTSSRFAERKRLRKERRKRKEEGGSPLSFKRSGPSQSSRSIPEYTTFERILAPSGEKQCRTCLNSYPQIYTVGWMCCSPTCSEFWGIHDGSSPSQGSLEFHQDFISVRAQSASSMKDRIPFSLSPPQPDLTSSDTSIKALRGWHCLKCGRLNCREFYSDWVCFHCLNKLVPKFNPFKPPSRLNRNALLTDTIIHQDFQNEVKVSSSIINGSKLCVTTYTLPAKFGKARVHIVEALEGEDLEADRLLEDFQTSEVPFTRHPLGKHAIKGRLLSQQFTCNYGTPYKHLVETSTRSFETAPSVVPRCLELIKSRTSLAVEVAKHQDFNELYPVLYLLSQSMHFHDDGQPGLGPIVSSLSLGSDAIMRFRVKQSKSKRKAAQEDGKEDEGGKVILKFHLRHGSVVIQDGKDLQTYCEHSVEPVGERIAVTARYIDEKVNGGKGKKG